MSRRASLSKCDNQLSSSRFLGAYGPTTLKMGLGLVPPSLQVRVLTFP